MAKKTDTSRIAYLALSAFLIAFQGAVVMGFGVLFPFLLFLSATSVCIMVAQFLRFNSDSDGRIQIVAAAGIALLTVIGIAILLSKGYPLVSTANFFEYLVVFCFMTFAALLPLLFGADLLRRFKDRRLKALGVGLIAFAVLVIIIFVAVGFARISVNDAVWLTYQGDRAILMGHNPYTLNYTGLYGAVRNGSATSFTLMSDGRTDGVLGYPFLYLALMMPFAALSATVAQFSRMLLFELIAYALVLFATIAHFGRRIGRREIVALLLVVPLLFFLLVSVVDVVMIVALLVAYLRPNRWYFGIALGLAVSIQQLAWIPAALLLLYSIVNSKPRKALLDVAVLAATVLVANGYFLLASPMAYLHNILGTLAHVLPTALSPFAMLLIRYYNLPLPYFQILFYLALALSAVLFLHFGRRRNFAILSLVPFLFLGFARVEYYAVFMGIGVLAAVLDRNNALNKKVSIMEPNTAHLAIAAIAIAMIALIIYGHASYLRAFPIVASGPSLQVSNGTLVYSALLSTGSLNGSERVLLYSFYRYINDSSAMPVFINHETVNLQRQGGSSAYVFNEPEGLPDNLVQIRHGSNTPTGITIVSQEDNGTYADCAIYNATYFYLCPTAGPAAT